MKLRSTIIYNSAVFLLNIKHSKQNSCLCNLYFICTMFASYLFLASPPKVFWEKKEKKSMIFQHISHSLCSISLCEVLLVTIGSAVVLGEAKVQNNLASANEKWALFQVFSLKEKGGPASLCIQTNSNNYAGVCVDKENYHCVYML